jgi:hypothetical protein
VHERDARASASRSSWNRQASLRTSAVGSASLDPGSATRPTFEKVPSSAALGLPLAISPAPPVAR